jgi:hypothetical protein
VTVVAQWAKAPGIHCYAAGSIPAVTPRYCTKKIEKRSLEHKKTKEKKKGLESLKRMYLVTRAEVQWPQYCETVISTT